MICDWCQQETTKVRGCSDNKGIEIHGKRLTPIRFGQEKRDGVDAKAERCPDCHAVQGQHHHPGCDVEECPACGGQLKLCLGGSEYEESEDEGYIPGEPEPNEEETYEIDTSGVCYREGCEKPTPDIDRYGIPWTAQVYRTDPVLDRNGGGYIQPSLVLFCSHSCNVKWIKQEARAAERDDRAFGMLLRIARDFAPKVMFSRHDVPDISQIPTILPEPHDDDEG